MGEGELSHGSTNMCKRICPSNMQVCVKNGGDGFSKKKEIRTLVLWLLFSVKTEKHLNASELRIQAKFRQELELPSLLFIRKLKRKVK